MRDVRRLRSSHGTGGGWFGSFKGWLLPLSAVVLLGWFIGVKWFSGGGGKGETASAEPKKGAIRIAGESGAPGAGDHAANATATPTAKPENFTFYKTLGQSGKAPAPPVVHPPVVQKVNPPVAQKPKTPPNVKSASAVKRAPSPEPKKPSAASSGASEKAGDEYTLQVSSFSDEKSATTMMDSLKSRGYAPTLSSAKLSDGKTVYRVRIGRYATREAADRAAERYHSEGKGTALVQAR